MMLERNFTKKVKDWLKTLPNTWLVKIQQRSVNGTPDILACINGRFVALELKRSKAAKRSPLQTFTLNKIRDAKGYALFLYPEIYEEIKQDIERMAHDNSQS